MLTRFMQYLQRALQTKTGQNCSAVAQKSYGVCVAYLSKNLSAQPELSAAIDWLPRGLAPEDYLCRIRALVHERTSDSWRAENARRIAVGSQPHSLHHVLEEAGEY